MEPIQISNEATVLAHKHYRVVRASGKDSMVLAAMVRGEWSERVAVSKRREVEQTSDIAEDIKKGGAFVLTRHNVPVGGAIYVPVKSSAWEIRRLGVTNAFAGRGFTSMLLKAMEASAKKRNIEVMRVAVEAKRPNVRLYFEEQGYRVINADSFLTQFVAASRPVTLQKYLVM
jgi:N-acetylglutamate synthase-like GNAT family acetyltransferase